MQGPARCSKRSEGSRAGPVSGTRDWGALEPREDDGHEREHAAESDAEDPVEDVEATVDVRAQLVDLAA